MKITAFAAALVLGSVLLPGAATGAEPVTTGGSGGSLLGSPLVVPGVQLLDEGEQAQEQEHARLASPEAVAARNASRTKFTHLAAHRAAALASALFPTVLNRLAGGPPQLPSGQRITGYLTNNSASVDLGGGRSGIIESLEPIAMRTHGHHRSPIDLRLRAAGASFRPIAASTGVSFPRHLGAGVTLPHVGLSLTPIDAAGSPLAGSEGSIDGATVIYANTETDADTLLKPTPDGFEVDALLRSVASPTQLSYRIGLSAGARLVQQPQGSGPVHVLDDGLIVATVLPPTAEDAAGTPVPVRMTIAGTTLVLKLADHAGSYRYPIVVDPTFTEEQLATNGSKRTNWQFHSNFAGFTEYATNTPPAHLETRAVSVTYGPGQFAYWAYQTQGNSEIYGVTVATYAENKGAHIESALELMYGAEVNTGEIAKATRENRELLSTDAEPEYTEKITTLCSKVGFCVPGTGHPHNAVVFEQSVAKACTSCTFFDALRKGFIYLSEPETARTSINTTSPEFGFEVEHEGKKEKQTRHNSLYPPVSWISDHQGALEFIAEDPGIGVSEGKLEYESSPGAWEPIFDHNYLEAEDDCTGVQCYPKHTEDWTLNNRLPDGEDTIRYMARDAMSGSESAVTTKNVAKIKVDHSPPHALVLEGLPPTNEIREGEYQVTARATDGEDSVPSSGISTIGLSVGGKKLVPTAPGSCSEGPCTASAKFTINGAEIGAGNAAVVMTAIDNAGNEARHGEVISVLHSAPLPLGPGTVSPESGAFSLVTADVSMGSGLNLSRAYNSRNRTAGEDGPLGGQWSLSMGSTESLTPQGEEGKEGKEGSVEMTSANGTQTLFLSLGEGKGFESPTGDSNITLTVQENPERTKVLAYYLKNAADKSEVEFTQPPGVAAWVPTTQNGDSATDTVTYKYQSATAQTEYGCGCSEQTGITSGPDGKLWFTQGARVGTATTAGVLSSYALPGGSEALRIAPGVEGDMWYTERGTHKVGKMTTAGTVKAEYSLSEGPNGGITAGPDGNMWMTAGSSIVRMTPTGELKWYPLAKESLPFEIAQGPDQTLWYTNPGTNKIGKITTGGGITEYGPLPTGSKPWGIAVDAAGNVWFTDLGTSMIGEITPGGAITEHKLPAESKPIAITAGPEGSMWFTDSGTNKVGKITASGVMSEYALPSATEPYGITLGPDGDLWYADGGDGGGEVGKIPPAGAVTEPVEVRAPTPAGVSCSWTTKPTEMHAGCRALEFRYATATTASGETEWGEYKRRLMKVLLVAYNPATSSMQETAVAEYAYDSQGRLRAEWDPRVPSPLKTTYGYDPEGHVTAVTSPGLQPWLITYGTSAGDSGSGRVVKVTRTQPEPGASEEVVYKQLKEHAEPVKNSEPPQITGSPLVGTRLAVSEGKWSGNPSTYGYQWEDCNYEGVGCAPITGATNPNYTVAASDGGHGLVAVVTATNGGGSATSVTAVTGVAGATAEEYESGCECAENLGIASGPDGNLWVTEQRNRIGTVTTAGATSWHTIPSGSEPIRIAAGPEKDLWYSERGTHKIAKMSTAGTVIAEYSLAGETPNGGITDGPEGNIWFTAGSAIGRLTPAGALSWYPAAKGSLPFEITVGPDKNLWFTNPGDNKIGKITPAGAITEYGPLPAESKPWGITSGPDGNLWFVDTGTSTIGKITTAGAIGESPLPPGSRPIDITTGPDGNLWFTELGTSKIGKFTTSGALTEYALPGRTAPVGITLGSNGDLWYADSGGGGGVVGQIPATGLGKAVEGEARAPSPGWTVEYHVPLSGPGLQTMTSAETARWGQADNPAEATAIIPPDSPQGWPAGSYTRATTYYLDELGRLVNVSQPSSAKDGAVSTAEYNEWNGVARTLTPENRAVALETGGSESASRAALLDTQDVYNGERAKESEVANPGTELVEQWGPEHEVKFEGNEAMARSLRLFSYDQGVPDEKPFDEESYDLETESKEYAAVVSNGERREVRTTKTSYAGVGPGQTNVGWTLRSPTEVTSDPTEEKPGQLNISHATLYSPTSGQVIETRGAEGLAGESAHDTRTIYYESEASPEGFTECGSHPEWAGLICKTLPAKQPETSGVPKVPVTTTRYNVWSEPESIEEVFGSGAEASTRTTVNTYDTAGRLTGGEEHSSATGTSRDLALPKVTDEYNSKTGVLERQSMPWEGTTKAVTNEYDTLGRRVTYMDADGNVAKFRYGGPENDEMLEEMSDSSPGGKGGGRSTETYGYDPVTKELTSLVDSGAGTFTAARNIDGSVSSEVYPNGMCANYTYNAVEEATGVEYVKTTNCAESAPKVWFQEARVPSIHGETMKRVSSFAEEEYGYDALGRLTETQETPEGGTGCVVRLYSYDEESDRTSLTTRKPKKAACATSGGTVESHSYDEANRLTDTGIAYDPLGNVTKLPKADAEGEEVASTFYVDNAVASQTQGKVTDEYSLDPEGRVRTTLATEKKGKTIKNNFTSYYDSPGADVAWTEETGKWARNVAGIDGTLAAVETNGESVLQIHDLEGNIVATAADNVTATEITSKYNPTEFGVPTGGAAPPKFAWLGASDIASERETGLITEGATSYVPQIGMALQSEQTEQPGLPDGSGGGVAYTAQEEPWIFQGAARDAEESPGREAGREREVAEAACRANPVACGGGGEGAGAGEEEGGAVGGDPVHCFAEATITVSGRVLTTRGGYECKGPPWEVTGVNALVEACVERWSERKLEYIQIKASCHEHVFVDTGAGGGEGRYSCVKGYDYRAWAWAFFWGLGGVWVKDPQEIWSEDVTCA
jgi:streptogramin lyase